MIPRIRQVGASGSKVIKITYAGFFKCGFHGCASTSGTLGGVGHILSLKDFLNCSLGFVKNEEGPAEAKELRLRECKHQVALQRSRERAGINESGVAIGEQAYKCSASSVARPPTEAQLAPGQRGGQRVRTLPTT